MTPTTTPNDHQISAAQSRNASIGPSTGSGRSSTCAATTGTKCRLASTRSTKPRNRPGTDTGTRTPAGAGAGAAAARRVNCRNVNVRRTVTGANLTHAARCSRPAVNTRSAPRNTAASTTRLEKSRPSIPHSPNTAALPQCIGDPANACVPALQNTTPAPATPKASPNTRTASRSANGERQRFA